MNEQYNDIEQLSKDAATKGLIPFDDTAWQKMEAMLDKEEPKKPLLWWWQNNMWLILLCTTITLAGAVGMYKYATTKKQTNTSESNTTIKQSIQTSNISNTATITNITSATPPIKDINSTITANDATKEATATDPILINNTQQTTYNINKKNSGDNYVAKRNIIQKKYTTITPNDTKVIVNENVEDNKQKEDNLVLPNEAIVIKEATNNSPEKDVTLINTQLQQIDSPILTVYKENIPTQKNNDSSKTPPPITAKKESKKKVSLLEKLSVTGVILNEYNTVKYASFTKPTTQYGISIEYAFAKKWAISIGILKGKKDYTTNKQGYKYDAGSYWSTIDSFTVAAVCNMIDVPINLRYTLSDNKRRALFTRVGLTSYWLKKEDYVFDYKRWGQPYTKSYSYSNANKKILSTVNVSLGYQYKASKRLAILTEPYIKLPLQGIGAGKVNLTSIGVLFGVQYSPWRK